MSQSRSESATKKAEALALKRAQALKANLSRRKQQARDRSDETVAQDKDPRG